jgi:uncharacterized protein (TIGR02444 family)
MSTDLWQYAQAIYKQPGVEAACLRLQDQGADVCLLLCACWLQQRQVVIQPQHLIELKQLAGAWQTRVVQPLRSLRQQWRGESQLDSALRGLREQLKTLELQAERELLQRLEHQSRDWPGGSGAANWLDALAPMQADRDALQCLRAASAAKA